MANWCSFTVKVTGARHNLAILAEMVLKDSGIDQAGDRLLNFDKMLQAGNATNPEWCRIRDITLHPQPVRREDGETVIEPALIEFSGDMKQDPPLDSLKALSKVWPTLVFELSYSIQGMWDEGLWRIENGNAKCLDHHQGYFHTAKDGEPSRWWYELRTDDPAAAAEIRKLLWEQGECIHGEPTIAAGTDVSRRPRPDQVPAR